ncbi:hypothetical protein IP91_03842 [Pseudoduganella lurida]|uniref:Uncharacterized protein n=1 Tax=Pseudoduganella lurida TaxID=1036180 RepID=A0A562R1P8_9BURK|nr:hypothetical protein [Pseudoduganella lurida]TWI63002.1 hypothetical protein IP91_03842 [Pseudoduganella lurida]
MAIDLPPDANDDALRGARDDAALSARGAARRRFARAGAAASGVLLTLHSQPGMACEICTTPSGSLSGGLQSFRGRPPVCAGRTPDYWRTHSWPTGTSKTALYTKLFACSGAYARTYGAVTQSAILEPKAWDTYGLGRHLVACHLNVRAGLSTFQTLAMLQAIWREYQARGYYTPTAGVRWDGARIVDYLRGTMY